MSCISCSRAKTVGQCELCDGKVCKDCIHYLEPTRLAFQKKLAPELKHFRYCPACYDETVVPALDDYDEILARAREVFVFFTTQQKRMPILKRGKERFKVEDCPDRDETILRLAFFAAEMGYNCILEVSVESEKVRNAGYQKSKWRGEGIPAQVDAAKLNREDLYE